VILTFFSHPEAYNDDMLQ